jgi:macrolide-specific efflux system membrane fusion protein
LSDGEHDGALTYGPAGFSISLQSFFAKLTAAKAQVWQVPLAAAPAAWGEYMLKLRKWHVVAGGVAALVIAVVAMSATHRGKQPAYATALVARGDVDETVLATGALQPSQLVSVGAQVSGRVESLKVELGDHVTKGQVIATIDPVPATNQLKTAQAALAQQIAARAAQAATLAQADLALKRQAITVAADASSRADYEAAQATAGAARANLAALDAQIAQAKVNVDTARVNLGYTNIVAPITGQVLSVVTKQGQTVNSVQAAPTIVILGDMSVMTVKAQISEADAIKVKPGQAVYFTVLGDPDRRFYGKLRSIAPAPNSIVSEVNVSTQTSSTSSTSTAIYYDGLFDVPNPDAVLKADMTAQVTVMQAQAKGVVTVPSAALDPAPLPGAAPATTAAPPAPRPAGEHTVLVLDERGRAVPRAVRIGLNNNLVAQVISGLSPGEKVVIGVAAPARQPPGQRSPPPRP